MACSKKIQVLGNLGLTFLLPFLLVLHSCGPSMERGNFTRSNGFRVEVSSGGEIIDNHLEPLVLRKSLNKQTLDVLKNKYENSFFIPFEFIPRYTKKGTLRGSLVVSVNTYSEFLIPGIKKGDFIRNINRNEPFGKNGYTRLLELLYEEKEVQLSFQRDGKARKLILSVVENGDEWQCKKKCVWVCNI